MHYVAVTQIGQERSQLHFFSRVEYRKMEVRDLAFLMMGLFLLVVVIVRVAFQFFLVGDSGVR